MKQRSRRGPRAGRSGCFSYYVDETLVGCATTLKIDVESIDEYTAREQLTPLIERVLDRPSMSKAQTSDHQDEEAT